MSGRPIEDEEDRRPGTQSVTRAGTGRALPFLAGVVVAAVVLLILKPWAADPSLPRPSGTPRANASSRPPASSPSTARTPARSPVPGSIPCISEVDWRVVTVERTAGRESRSWVAVEPRAAQGPRDPVPRVRVVAGRLLGLGFCAPESMRGGIGDVEVSRLSGTGGAGPVRPLAGLRLVAPAGSGAATVYAPPARAAAWPPGRYVFLLDTGSRRLAFGVEVVRARSDGGG
jgi:hypothetical protein